MKKKKDSQKNIVNFLFEVGILSKTPRSGFYFLGSGKQSVAEHINRVVFIGYTLAMLDKNINVEKVLKMCLLHDLGESRTSDLNYVHQKYARVDESAAVEDLASTLPFGEDISTTLKEYKDHKTREAQLAKDADQLELLLSLKEQMDIGNTRTNKWLPSLLKRLKTEVGKELAKEILSTDSDNWWIGDPNDEWWVSRKRKKR